MEESWARLSKKPAPSHACALKDRLNFKSLYSYIFFHLP